MRIAIFDDNNNVRQSIAMLLSTTNSYKLVGSFSSAKNCLNDVKQCQPDIILMDIEMPEVSGIEAVKLIKKNYPEIIIIMQTVFEDDGKVFESICAGAYGYLLKSSLSKKLLSSLDEIVMGGAPMTPIIGSKVLGKMKLMLSLKETNLFPDYHLTARELAVLQLIVDGLNHKNIAIHLNISYDTVRSHVKKIYAKLHVVTLSEAVILALKQKIV